MQLCESSILSRNEDDNYIDTDILSANFGWDSFTGVCDSDWSTNMSQISPIICDANPVSSLHNYASKNSEFNAANVTLENEDTVTQLMDTISHRSSFSFPSTETIDQVSPLLNVIPEYLRNSRRASSFGKNPLSC